MVAAKFRRAYEPKIAIDYKKLAEAQLYYEQHRYKYIEVPWVVDSASTQVTLPSGRIATQVQYGDLVGSGEQSFIELLRRGGHIQKAMCITSCFRLEQTFDALHHAYFMKLELISLRATVANLHAMIDTATSFHGRYLDVHTVQTGSDTYDIIAARSGIELGSYGFRRFDDTTFIYGTGIALPRMDVAIAQQP